MSDNIKDMHELSDEMLDKVTGGAGTVQIMNIACPHCGHINTVDVMKSSFTCKECAKVVKIDG